MSKAIKIKIYIKLWWNQLQCTSMGCDWDGYEKTEYMGTEIIKNDVWTTGRARNTENKD